MVAVQRRGLNRRNRKGRVLQHHSKFHVPEKDSGWGRHEQVTDGKGDEQQGRCGGRHGGWVVAAVDAAGDNPAVMRRAAVGAGACALVLEGTVGNWQER